MGWDPVKDLKRAVSGVTNSVNRTLSNIGNNTNSFLAGAESGIRRDLTNIGKNIETNTQDTFNSLMAMTQPGGLNNIGQTLLGNYLAIGTGGLINTKDKRKIAGQGNIERMEVEAISKAEEQLRMDQQAMVDEQNRQVSGFLSQITEGQRRTPGRAQTLLGGRSRSNNTLLTLR